MKRMGRSHLNLEKILYYEEMDISMASLSKAKGRVANSEDYKKKKKTAKCMRKQTGRRNRIEGQPVHCSFCLLGSQPVFQAQL